ncbi:MAG: 30S ribosomal protein S9, partial [Bacteroidia bacterium]
MSSVIKEKILEVQEKLAVVREPKIDAQGRSYATGKRKNAIARVWIKKGSGKIQVNG